MFNDPFLMPLNLEQKFTVLRLCKNLLKCFLEAFMAAVVSHLFSLPVSLNYLLKFYFSNIYEEPDSKSTGSLVSITLTQNVKDNIKVAT